MNIKIGDRVLKLEFTFEAALYEECVEKVMNLFGGMAEAQDTKDSREMIKEIAAMPGTVITMFYAGLLEHNPVNAQEDAKALLKQYFKENPDAKDASFYGMATSLIAQMEKDGFFKQIGLMTEEAGNQPKTPQDHKKPVKGAIEKK